MEVLRTISFYADSKHVQFLVIGGHAVNAYGLSRQTGDIDLLVRSHDKIFWDDLLVKLDYSPFQNDDRFARYAPRQLAAWPIDLMFVDDSTFEKLVNQSDYKQIGVAKVRVVSARHLIALKIHALKHFQEHRYNKDFTDLEALLRANVANISEEELRDLCVKYASIDLYNKLRGG